MSDPRNPIDPGNSSGDPIDARLRQLVADASADAPPAPDPATFVPGTPGAVRSLDTARQRRRRWLTGGAIGLTAAAAAVTFLVFDNEPTDTLVPATVPITEPLLVPATTVPAPTASTVPEPAPTTAPEQQPSDTDDTQPEPTAAASTTDEPADADGEPTRVAITPTATSREVYDFDFATTTDVGEVLHTARYRTSDRQHAVYIRSTAGEGEPEGDPALATLPSGREVYDANSSEGCSDLACAVWVPWDESTTVSIQWMARPGSNESTADLDELLARLVDVAGQLVDGAERVPFFRPAVTAGGPTISSDGIIVADASGIVARDSWDGERQLTTQSAGSAVGLPDGRVIATTGTGRGLPGELRIIDPSAEPDAELDQMWVGGVPDDGSARIVLMDAATVDGVSTILYQVVTGSCSGGQDGTFECDGVLEVATIPAIDAELAVDRRVVRDLGSVWEKSIAVDLNDGQSLPDISGVVYDLVIATPYFDSLEDDWIDLSSSYEAAYSEATVHIGMRDGYLVDYIDEPDFDQPDNPMVRISDRVGDAETDFSIDGLLPITGFTEEPGPVLDLVPNIWRGSTFGAEGTVWIETYENAEPSDDPELRVTTLFIEVDLDGNEVSRIATGQNADLPATLTTTNS
jgi:hypothetical protein